MSNLAVETLLTKRSQLFAEMEKANERYQFEISLMDSAIEELTGKKIGEVVEQEQYDDENKDYIRASQEEI